MRKVNHLVMLDLKVKRFGLGCIEVKQCTAKSENVGEVVTDRAIIDHQAEEARFSR
eukprot:CAMPEP_0177556294 /NCGR_PEP_ID=MMETSP0369-20130122/69001_1 /TAXON_ID=447022 ORGANISM="Scrippsiella hangoei-like, Strain SHHI-4" /NCGR_SAMPLE_ID=MMETSP0369 /ASSEMBLY_ACC=CAM_ASM_000364 /LENGTH=55 /DNA_ID=CAMNT_0019042497 /DNA_START=185 /DNA_END=349 /DNA_ORIENTATION=+